MTETETSDTHEARPAGAVAICTKDRPGELEISISAAHAASPAIPILVVDASASEATREVCERLSANVPSLALTHHRARRPGLARQRNEAIALCRELGVDVVHFIDDDTEVDSGYFEAIERRFSKDPTVAGVGGVITNQPVFDYLAVRSFFLLRSRRRGSVLSSGRNMLGQYPGTRVEDPVEWLNGCSMSYRMSVFDEIAFDDRLEGPSLGEDYDFSFRLSRSRRLAVEPAARCIHHVTPAVRSSRRATAREGMVNVHRWVRENRVHGMSLAAFWWATFGDLLLHTGSWIVYSRAESLQEVRGIFDGVATIIRTRSRSM